MRATDEMSCAGSECTSIINSTNLQVNTTSTSDCATVAVQCPLTGQRLANMVSIYTCSNGDWIPLRPRSCIDEAGGSAVDIGVIVSCAVGAGICILIIAISIFLLVSNRRQARRDTQRQRIFQDQMQRVWEFASSVSRYNSVAELEERGGDSAVTDTARTTATDAVNT